MTLAGLGMRNLAHRPWRTGLTLLGVVLAIAAYVALVGLVRGVEGTLLENFETRGADVVMTEAGAADVLSSVVPDHLAPEIAALPGVADASPEMGRMTTIGERTTSFVHGWQPEAFAWEALRLTNGRFPVPEDQAGDVVAGVALGARLAERLGLSVGDRLDLFAAPFVITGVYQTDGLLTRNGAVMLLSDMQAQTYRVDQATSIVLRLEAGLSEAAREALITDLAARYPDLAVEATETMISEYINVRLARVLVWVVSAVAVMSAGLAVLNTMAMAVNERRGEIAIMGAVGWPRARIVSVLMLEGAWLTATGALLGVAVGVGVAWIVALAPAVEGFVEPDIDLGLMARAVGLGLVIGLLGAFVPAIRAASEDPAAILRGK